MLLSTIPIILNGLTLITALYLVFSKSYLQEKGKNLATKEDIGEITKTVEAIKTELALTGQLKFSIKTEERNALLECYTKYNLWLSLIMNFSLSNDDSNSNSCLIDEKQALNKAHFDFVITQAKVDLYIPDDSELIQILNNLNITTYSIHHKIETFVFDFVEMKERFIVDQNSNISSMEKSKLFNAFKSEMVQLIRKHDGERLEIYQNILKVNQTFKSKCYNILIQLHK